MTVYATDETFRDLVKEGVVIVDFFGKTCGPCKMIAKELEELEDEFPFLQIVKVDVEDCPQTAEEFRVEGIPDMYYYKDGEIVRHEVGAVNQDVIRSHLAEILY
jgi:thioredoxin 1